MLWLLLIFPIGALWIFVTLRALFRRVPRVWSERKAFFVDGELKVGVISDSQIYPFARKGKKGKFEESLTIALKYFKAQKVQLILYGGDLCNLGTRWAYNAVNRCFDEVFREEHPILQAILGNHDYWGFPTTRTRKARLLQKKLKVAPWSHYVVNGYHFIAASPDCGDTTDGYKNVLGWLDAEIKTAVAEGGARPVFVLTHHAPQGTVAGSEGFGDKRLNTVLKKYPTVVNISGHTHHSLLDERSIYQKDYTAVAAQSISYVELEKGKENGTVPPNAYAAAMGLLLGVQKTQIEIKRIQFRSEGSVEQKSGQRWVLPLPLEKDKFIYTEDRKIIDPLPQMTALNAEAIYDKKKVKLKFSAAVAGDYVRGYLVRFSDGTQQYYFSDFYRGLDKMTNMPRFTVMNKKRGLYDVRIYAVDGWGRVSENFATCNNVRVRKRYRYLKIYTTFLRKLPFINTFKQVAGYL